MDRIDLTTYTPLSPDDDRATASNAHVWPVDRGTIRVEPPCTMSFPCRGNAMFFDPVFPLHPARVGTLPLGERAGEARLQQVFEGPEPTRVHGRPRRRRKASADAEG